MIFFLLINYILNRRVLGKMGRKNDEAKFRNQMFTAVVTSIKSTLINRFSIQTNFQVLVKIS